MLRVAILVLGLATALIHLSLNVFGERFVPMFTLNGLGYLALVAAALAPMGWLDRRRELVLWAFMGYTALTILGWLAFGQRTPIAYADKIVEVLLVIALSQHRRTLSQVQSR